MNIKYRLREDPYDEAIVMTVDGDDRLQVFRLCPSGMGVTSDTRALAEKVVVFLNSLPEEERTLYPYKS